MENHRILNVLDSPARFLFWTIDEAVILFGVPFTSFMLDMGLLGLCISIASYWLLKKFKKKHSNTSELLYWHLPHFRKYRITPPSHIRRYLS